MTTLIHIVDNTGKYLKLIVIKNVFIFLPKYLVLANISNYNHRHRGKWTFGDTFYLCFV